MKFEETEIGLDQAKSPVTPYRNDWSHLSEMAGHDGPKYALRRMLPVSSGANATLVEQLS